MPDTAPLSSGLTAHLQPHTLSAGDAPPTIAPPLVPPAPEVTERDMVAAFVWIRAYAERYPALRPLISGAPPEWNPPVSGALPEGVLATLGYVVRGPEPEAVERAWYRSTVGLYLPPVSALACVLVDEGAAGEERVWALLESGREGAAYGPLARSATLLATQPRLRDVLPAYDAVRAAFYDEAAALAREVAAGRMTVDEFERAARVLIKNGHIAATVAATGGDWRGVSFSEWGRAGRRIRDQYDYLRRWAETMKAEAARRADRTPSATAGQIAARLSMYGDATRATFEAQRAALKGLPAGMLPAYPGDGTSRCLVRCKCRWDIRQQRGEGNWNVMWRLGRAEHCETCLARARGWGMLRIRSYRWTPHPPPPIFYER